ncbi:phosphonate C-P lyase system protein PhnL [Paenibacillus hemerocallicola]|uniref:Phosphonate C-P lyase system protein PhnL n=1 Tax=Paenibacillus hemerocallicola TaxID=1172614 RepID=A0A5C4SWH4_9BACL|nr:phosphonate C-P lyase system protein PhnL [Paenibacillus hemerocallicola]TNJ59300.1 phosphonate C-P lyase system protein PhnL [Paenibacillus hemerocallicola]
MLHVEALSKTFELSVTEQMRVHPFRDLSFSIPEGGFMGLAGPSGIGKSSILKCIYRTYLPTSGRVRFRSSMYGEIDLASADERRVAHLRKYELSYVSQFLKVIPRVSALDIVAERLLPLGYSLEAARDDAAGMLARLRIPETLWSAYPATFSGGEQQRINLARAFIVRPRLLILDEPTASLDRETTESVLALLQEMKRQGTTMIGVFHDWEIMKRVADRIFDLGEWKRSGVSSSAQLI